MNTRKTAKASGWFTGRTRLITLASSVAVAVAGATAVGANIGILNSASNSSVGVAAATSDVSTLPPTVVDVYLPESYTNKVQQFVVADAGTVGVVTTSNGLRLDGVLPTTGWSWTLNQSDPASLTVQFSSGANSYEFVAMLASDGTVTGTVNEIIVASYYDDDYDDYDDDYDDYAECMADADEEDDREDCEKKRLKGAEDDD